MVKNLPAMQESRVWSLGWEDTVEKWTATHSSILAWRIPWTEEPGVLQSMGSQTLGPDWATNTHMLEDEEEPGSESPLPDSRGYFPTATWPPATQFFITAPPPAITLSQGPLKLSSLSVQCSEPQALGQFTDFWEVSHSFPLGSCFEGIATISVFLLGGSFLYPPLLLLEKVLLYLSQVRSSFPFCCIHIYFYFISLHLKYRWRQAQTLWILCLGKRQLLHFFFLVLITGDFSEKPSYWFYHSLTSYFQLLFEAWHWCERYFASNCLRGLINKVDDSHILPCFVRLVISPTLNI